MSLLGGNDLKEQQRINDLQQKITREKQKLNKKLTRQKILLGAFLIDLLEKDKVDGLREYVAYYLPQYLEKPSDKALLQGLVESLGGAMFLEDNKR